MLKEKLSTFKKKLSVAIVCVYVKNNSRWVGGIGITALTADNYDPTLEAIAQLKGQ